MQVGIYIKYLTLVIATPEPESVPWPPNSTACKNRNTRRKGEQKNEKLSSDPFEPRH
jgi:hypothetical protein